MTHPFSGYGLDLDEALLTLPPVQRDILTAMLSGDDESTDVDLVARHNLTLPDLMRMRWQACAWLRDLLTLHTT